MEKLLINKQPILTKIINKINNSSANTQAYLLIGDDCQKLKEYSILLSKALICPNGFRNNCNKNCNICKRIDVCNYGELKIINPINNMIKKDVIISLRDSLQTSSIEGRNQVYIINNVETLNSSAANSILKFLEEPDSNTVAVFTSTNLGAVMETIISRCQVIKINNPENVQGLDFVIKMTTLNQDQIDLVIKFVEKLENNYSSSLCYVNDLVLNNFNTRDLVTGFLNCCILIYKDMFNYIITNKLIYFKDDRIINMSIKQNPNKITKKISFLLENIKKIDYNVNMLLFFDNLIIGMGVINDG